MSKCLGGPCGMAPEIRCAVCELTERIAELEESAQFWRDLADQRLEDWERDAARLRAIEAGQN